MYSPFKDHPQGITQIDTGYLRPGFAAAYLIENQGRAVFIETGPLPAVPLLLAALERRNLSCEAVDAIIVTHVHLDHAGGAGELLQQLPNARLFVHTLGARHLIDPAKLVAGATAVYGETVFKNILGSVTPAPADRVHTPADNESFFLQDRPLVFIDSPGHARHHLCVWDAVGDGLFTGDAFGISYREFDHDSKPYLFPATTPVQFDPDASHRTIDRLTSIHPEWLYLTHFGPIPFSPSLAANLHQQLDQFITVAESNKVASGAVRQERLISALKNLSQEQLSSHNPNLGQDLLELLTMDWEINAQGLAVWLDRRQ